MLNRDVLARNPSLAIPNDGVAKVGRPTNDNEWHVLRYELQSFVCEGEYARGLERVLDTYLGNLDQATQPAAWISGFYGSGKSHFVRVLDALWSDLEFPDGARARTLVQHLPESIAANLAELTTRGRQAGGVWSASGQLAKGVSSPRLGLLDLLFDAAGLPAGYAPGKFLLWLRQDGYEEAVRASLGAAGKSLEREVINLYVSPFLGKALVEAIPGFAADGPAALAALRDQFPRATDVSEDELFETMRSILLRQSTDGATPPLTLIVLDELQQYIGDESSRSYEVQNIVEACSSSFGSRILFAATGQAALQGTSQLQRLQGRFTVRVQLSSNDVHTVVTNVVLQKKQDALPALTKLVDDCAAEIDRQLAGTKLGATPADRKDLVPDYPLLPVRRRFIEAVLNEIDLGGTAGQARSQLKVIQQAVRGIADESIGHVIPVDVVFEQKRAEMLQAGTLLRETDLAITAEANSGKPDAQLRARLLGVIFLMSKLPEAGLKVTGVKATPEMLADLLVEDITESSASFREGVRQALDGMVSDALLMLVEGQYHIQTRESQEWQGEYRRRFNQIKEDSGRISGDRGDALRRAIDAYLKGMQILQGVTKTKRDWTLHFGSEPPVVQGGTIPVWVRDEWSVTEAGVRDETQRAGVNSPILTIFLPKRSAGHLADALASVAAANETLDTRPVPTTDEGIQARGAMQTLRDTEQNRLSAIINQVLDDARVYQGGGTEVTAPSPKEAIRTGLEASALRLFPKFDTADQTGWDKVVKGANDGAGNPLEKLGYKGEVDGNQACSEILNWLGQARTGNQIRSHFMAPPYGWPQDAVHGGLLALVADGKVKASYAGKARTPKELPHPQIGQTDFVRESQPLGATEKIELAALMKETIGPVSPADAPGRVPALLTTLAGLSASAGGDPPLPARPDTQLLTELQAQSGNVQARGAHQHRDLLRTWFREWSEANAKRASREQKWQRLQALLKQASGLAACDEIRTQAEAIRSNRSLLFDPDPVTPLIAATADALRAALQDARNRHVEARKAMVEQLSATAEWNLLNDAQWKYLLAKEGLGVLPPLEIGTEEHLLKALDERSLAVWEAEIAALPTRMQHAHEGAVRLLTPKAVKVTVKNATLTTGDEVDTYLNELRARIMTEIEQGAPVLVQGS